MKRILIAAALVASLATASAQFGGPPSGASAAMMKLFGETKAFSAKANARLLDKDQKEVATMPMTMALRDGKLRSDLDMGDVKAEYKINQDYASLSLDPQTLTAIVAAWQSGAYAKPDLRA